jgi:hypothetical protein
MPKYTKEDYDVLSTLIPPEGIEGLSIPREVVLLETFIKTLAIKMLQEGRNDEHYGTYLFQSYNRLNNLLFKTKLEDLPLRVNDPQFAVFVKWRLTIAK